MCPILFRIKFAREVKVDSCKESSVYDCRHYSFRSALSAISESNHLHTAHQTEL